MWNHLNFLECTYLSTFLVDSKDFYYSSCTGFAIELREEEKGFNYSSLLSLLYRYARIMHRPILGIWA